MDSFLILLFFKTLILIFILSSPFYNVQQVFYFLNNFPAKILLLILVIGVSFIDIQLAIITSIAFFILLISFIQHKDINKLNKIKTNPILSQNITVKQQIQDDYSKNVISNTYKGTDETNIYTIDNNANIETPKGALDNIIAPITRYDDMPDIQKLYNNPGHTMYNFPDNKCNMPRQANNEYMNNAQISYTLDEKIKPYEEFIYQMTNLDSLENMCNAGYVM